tara:strand:- start:453 stop:1007 length:555 start_codon:yes stop_codon:yes gene_type:complete
MHILFLEKYFFVDSFAPSVIKCQDKNTVIIYRNYNKKNNIKEIINLRNFCKKNKYKIVLANNVKLALKLRLNGAYLPSFNKKFEHLSYSFDKNFILIGSAHNSKEIKIKEKQKINKIFLSSLFKKNGNYLGLNKFKIYTSRSKSQFVALGGITEVNLKKINLINVTGFAGITFFKKKGPLKKGP